MPGTENKTWPLGAQSLAGKPDTWAGSSEQWTQSHLGIHTGRGTPVSPPPSTWGGAGKGERRLTSHREKNRQLILKDSSPFSSSGASWVFLHTTEVLLTQSVISFNSCSILTPGVALLALKSQIFYLSLGPKTQIIQVFHLVPEDGSRGPCFPRHRWSQERWPLCTLKSIPPYARKLGSSLWDQSLPWSWCPHSVSP